MDKTCEIVALFFVLDAILLFYRSHICSSINWPQNLHWHYEVIEHFQIFFFPFVISSTKFIDQMIWFYFLHEIFLYITKFFMNDLASFE